MSISEVNLVGEWGLMVDFIGTLGLLGAGVLGACLYSEAECLITKFRFHFNFKYIAQERCPLCATLLVLEKWLLLIDQIHIKLRKPPKIVRGFCRQPNSL